jgi:hypothetical protein
MRRITSRILLIAVLALAGVGWPDASHAQATVAPQRLGPEWIAVKPATLDAYRGGYEMPSGLLLSFGIERVAFVNGQLVSSLRISIPDIRNITAAQAQELARLNETQLVQVGAGNVFHGAGNGGLVIQNTLDGQDIRAQTTLDVGVNTLGLFQALNIGEAMRNASSTAPGAP